MAANQTLKKIGTLKVADGLRTKDGKTRAWYHEIGTVFATPHRSVIRIKFHATASGEGKTAQIFYDEGCAPRDQSGANTLTPDAAAQEPKADPQKNSLDTVDELFDIYVCGRCGKRHDRGMRFKRCECGGLVIMKTDKHEEAKNQLSQKAQ